MAPTPVDLSKHDANVGIEALNMGNRQKASDHFWKALDHLADVDDLTVRRDYLAAFSLMCDKAQFPDIALAASQDAVEIDEQEKDTRKLTNDLLDLGNIQKNMNSLDDAVESYERALKLCLQEKYYDNAAAATTNLAGILWNRNENAHAIAKMKKSLGYLKKGDAPDTEITTRVYLSNMLVYEKHDPEQVFKVVKPVIAKFSDRLTGDQWDVIRSSLDQAIERYAEENPKIDTKAWKVANFPTLYG